MIKEQKKINVFDVATGRANLHSEFQNILFENRHFVSRIFREVIGFYDINHISITIINPLNEIVAFSLTPSIEYNLINQGLWTHDLTFASKMNDVNSLIFWDENSVECDFFEIKKIKLTNYNFTLGMTVPREIDNYCFLYSFATKRNCENIREYYESNITGLIDIGDYCYKSIRTVFASYCLYSPPDITNLNLQSRLRKNKLYIKLIINNSIL